MFNDYLFLNINVCLTIDSIKVDNVLFAVVDGLVFKENYADYNTRKMDIPTKISIMLKKNNNNNN